MTNRWLNSFLSSRLTGWQRVSFHGSAWGIYMAYETASIYYAYKRLGNVADYCLFYLLNISLFYANVFLLSQALHRNRFKLLKGMGSILGLAIIYLIVKHTLDHFLIRLRGLPDTITGDWSAYISVNLWRGIYFLIASSTYFVIKWMFRFRERAAEERSKALQLKVEQTALENKLIAAQNAYLRQQINPHFLFNTLSFVHNSFYQDNPTAATCISQLSDILRYCYQPADMDNKMPLAEEFFHTRQLIDLNRLRFDHPLHLEVDLFEATDNQKILPLVLLTLTENVFKHGNLKDAAHPATISAKQEAGGFLLFKTRNLKRRWKLPQGGGIGLDNTVKRLDRTYANRYKLTIIDEEDYYEVQLQLLL